MSSRQQHGVPRDALRRRRAGEARLRGARALGRVLTGAVALLATGCYGYRAGPLVRTDRVPDSERVLQESYAYQLAGWPTPANPVLSLRLTRDQSLEYATVDLHEELRGPRRPLILLGGLSAVAVAYVAMGERDVDLSTAGTIAGLAGASIALSLFLSPTVPTGELREGRTHTDSTSTAGPLPAGTEVVVSVGEVERTLRSAESGLLRVDLVGDFGLTFFDDPAPLPVTVDAADGRRVASILVHPAEWTARCVRTAAPTVVVAAPADPQTRLGSVDAGAVRALRSDAHPDWYEIEHGAGSGWIARQAATPCWHVPSPAGRFSPPVR